MILINDPYLFFPHRQTFFSPPMCPRTPSSITLNHRMTYIFLVFESLGYVQDGVLRPMKRAFNFRCSRCACGQELKELEYYVFASGPGAWCSSHKLCSSREWSSVHR